MERDTIELQGKTYKECVVHTTRTMASPIRLEDDGTMRYDQEPSIASAGYLHIHITSKEEVRNLDALDSSIPLVFISDNQMIKSLANSNERVRTIGKYYQIIASTDKSLGVMRIPMEYVNGFIYMNNKGDRPTEALLEMEEYNHNQVNYHADGISVKSAFNEWRLRIRVPLDNTAVILNPMLDKTKKYGYHSHRLKKDDPYHQHEVKAMEAIHEMIKDNPTILPSILGRIDSPIISEEEEKAMLTVIQWLGTPVGKSLVNKIFDTQVF